MIKYQKKRKQKKEVNIDRNIKNKSNKPKIIVYFVTLVCKNWKTIHMDSEAANQIEPN